MKKQPLRIKITPGQRWGRLTVIEDLGIKNKHRYCLCKCDCGTICEKNYDMMKVGFVSSCGCYRREANKKRATTHGCTKNGKTDKLYRIWTGIKSRCCNPKDMHYQNYGGRGITICDKWMNDYVAFKEWSLTHGYAEGLSIDRIDNDKGYSPENCRWADKYTQANNTRGNHYITYNGETHTIAEWVRITGIRKNTILHRIKKGFSLEEVFFVGKFKATKNGREVLTEGGNL